MTDGPRQRSSTAGSSKDAADGNQSGSTVALKKEIGLVSACGIIIGKCTKAGIPEAWSVRHLGACVAVRMTKIRKFWGRGGFHRELCHSGWGSQR